MIGFTSHPECKLCSLFESAKNPGIPTRPLYDYHNRVPKDKALLIVGQNPGTNEDNDGRSWVGYTGQLLQKFIEAIGIYKYCDVYLANACRCRSPQKANIKQKQIRACREYLNTDIDMLLSNYGEVIVLCVGAKAVYSVTNISSLNESFKNQGALISVRKTTGLPDVRQVRVFSTFRLAILHPLRQPALVGPVEAHFLLVKRYLEGNFLPGDDLPDYEMGIPVPNDLPDIVSCDIETYGILEGVEQTVFNPIKSKYIDGVDFEDQVVSINFSWRDTVGILHAAQYVFNDPKHRSYIRKWFEVICKKKIVLLGQNIKFDLMYLACADVVLRYWIDPRRLTVDDTLILVFLLCELYPEKGLKEICLLFGIADYKKFKVTGKEGNAKSCWDKNLHKYNAADGVNTLKVQEETLRRLEEKYGKDSNKLGDTCVAMRNMIVWDTLDLDLNGSTLNVTKLEKFHDEQHTRSARLKRVTEERYGIKLAGTGSDKPLRQLFSECVVEAGLTLDSRVAYTNKEKKISIGVENANLLKKYLPKGKNLRIISFFQEFKERSKIVNTYTKPLLTNQRKGIVYKMGNRGMVFPSWYPIPSYFERGGSSDDKTGGQKQGRFSCKQPARQTEPSSIRGCSCSRWNGGKLVEYDVNQDHLRMAALLSGDPELMDAYVNPGESIHKRTAKTIFPNQEIKKGTTEYKLGKTLNFLVIFRGGASAFQSTALSDAEVEVSLEFCDNAIKTWYKKHQVYKLWQDNLIDLAAEQGYIVLPTGWGRTFAVGPSGVANYTNEICNMAHQIPCAQILQGIEFEVVKKFRENYMKSLICLQIYDAIFVDIYPNEEEAVDQIVAECFADPKILHVYEDWVGRKIDWLFEKKEYEV